MKKALYSAVFMTIATPDITCKYLDSVCSAVKVGFASGLECKQTQLTFRRYYKENIVHNGADHQAGHYSCKETMYDNRAV
jgi:hypothetical protein